MLFQQPSFLGSLEPTPDLVEAASEAGALAIAHVDPMSLGVLEAPGAFGAAIAIGEGQAAGNWPSYGGPHYGFLAARSEFVRRMPGRIVGETVDADGRRAFVLTLQTREQHIRREKATSNITTNQTLLALGGLATLSWLGPEGLREVGETCLALSQYVRERVPLEPAFDAPVFKEVAFRTPIPAREVVRRARERGVHPGYALGRDYEGMDNVLLVAVTEKRSVEDVDRLADVLEEVCAMSSRSRAARGRTRRWSSSARAPAAERDGRRGPIFPCRSCRSRFAARGRRDCPRSRSRSSSAISRRSPTAPSGSTPASIRSAPAR